MAWILRPDTGLSIRKAETRGEWTGSSPDDDDEPPRNKGEDIDCFEAGAFTDYNHYAVGDILTEV